MVSKKNFIKSILIAPILGGVLGSLITALLVLMITYSFSTAGVILLFGPVYSLIFTYPIIVILGWPLVAQLEKRNIVSYKWYVLAGGLIGLLISAAIIIVGLFQNLELNDAPPILMVMPLYGGCIGLILCHFLKRYRS